MADKGSSHWNGNYGSDEAERRKNYDRATHFMRGLKALGPGGQAEKSLGKTTQEMADSISKKVRPYSE